MLYTSIKHKHVDTRHDTELQTKQYIRLTRTRDAYDVGNTNNLELNHIGSAVSNNSYDIGKVNW